MIFEDTVFIVYLDGDFVGICEDEDCIWEVAQNHTNGTSYPLTDDNYPDRVWTNKIHINRWRIYPNTVTAIEDKYTGKSFSHPYGLPVTQNIVNQLNDVDLEREKAEAKVRALLL